MNNFKIQIDHLDADLLTIEKGESFVDIEKFCLKISSILEIGTYIDEAEYVKCRKAYIETNPRRQVTFNEISIEDFSIYNQLVKIWKEHLSRERTN